MQRCNWHVQVEEITKEDFLLPKLGPKMEIIHKDLIYGVYLL